jgi:GTP cyclohydrolase I
MATNVAFEVDTRAVERIVEQLLYAIGEDPKREGLQNTPARVARFWKEFIEYDPGNHETVFESVKVNQMVAVSGMRVWSLCEHHLLPFWCDVSIGYIANDKVLGLSKFGRIAKKHAHKLQVQERLVENIAADVIKIVGTENVAVIAKGEHLCMTMRGIQTPAVMSSSSINGSFLHAEVRAEFLSLIGG